MGDATMKLVSDVFMLVFLVAIAAISVLIFNPQPAPAQTITQDFAERTMRSVLPPNAECSSSSAPLPRSMCKIIMGDLSALVFEYTENLKNEPSVSTFFFDQSGRMSGASSEAFVDFLSKFGLPKNDILDCLSTTGLNGKDEKVQGKLALHCDSRTDPTGIVVHAEIQWNRF